MARKPQKNPTARRPEATAANADKSRATTGGGAWWWQWLPVLVCFVAGYPCLQNKFTDWDDKGYILANPLLTDLSWKGMMHIFSEPVMGNYHPLTILSYALEYHLVQLEPLLYHFDNLLLHALVSWLVYRLVRRLLPSATR